MPDDSPVSERAKPFNVDRAQEIVNEEYASLPQLRQLVRDACCALAEARQEIERLRGELRSLNEHGLKARAERAEQAEAALVVAEREVRDLREERDSMHRACFPEYQAALANAHREIERLRQVIAQAYRASTFGAQSSIINDAAEQFGLDR